MAIRVEFYGIARQRAGVSGVAVDVPASSVSLADLYRELAIRLPIFGRELLSAGQLHESFSANVDGARFVSDPATRIEDGQCLLILSADAGG